VGRAPVRLIATGDRIWSTDFGGGTVTVVSASALQRERTIRVGPQPEGIVALAGDVWVVSQQGG
jgi:YVTN family beta-propeller protein